MFKTVGRWYIGAGKNDKMAIEMCHALAVKSSIPNLHFRTGIEVFLKGKKLINIQRIYFQKQLKGTDSCSFFFLCE